MSHGDGPTLGVNVSIASRLSTPPASRGTQMDKWVESLEPADREAVTKATLSPEWRHTDLLAALIEEGAPEIAEKTFGTWRRKKGWKP